MTARELLSIGCHWAVVFGLLIFAGAVLLDENPHFFETIFRGVNTTI